MGVVWRELVAKVAKEANLGKSSQGVPVHVQGCTGTPQQKAKCTGTRSGCTGTPHQNTMCIGIGPGCTGTHVSQMARMLCFCVFKPEFIHQ